jgi:hypothetical protein
MVMEDALENPTSIIKITPLCRFISMTVAYSELQNRVGFKNKWQLVKPQIAEVSQI